ncbi:hypothetical protein R84B8_00942 [Treponema sp. R8-4-B8]
MVKLSEKSRRVLRRIYQGLGAATVSILFQACYGMPMDNDNNVYISGAVSSKTNNPIQGIKVSVTNLSPDRYTNEEGIFNLFAPRLESYELRFEDVDGADNGSYKTLKKTITLSDTDTTLQIQLDEK